MKRKMRKFCGLVLAAVFTVSTALTAVAAPSPSVTGTVTQTTAATDANGNAIKVSISEVPAKYAEAVTEIKNIERVKELLGNSFKEEMKVIDVKEVTVPDGTAFPATLTFSVSGVKADTNVAVLHYDGSQWEVVDAKAGNGTITATFDSLSPVAFVVDQNTVNSAPAANSNSPKTGESSVAAVMGIAAVAAILAAFVVYRKRSFN